MLRLYVGFLCRVPVLWRVFVSFHHAEEERAGCFILTVLWLSSFCVSDVGWPAVCGHTLVLSGMNWAGKLNIALSPKNRTVRTPEY